MKKFKNLVIIGIVILITSILYAFAPVLTTLVTINSTGVYNYKGTSGDTIKKDGYTDVDLYVPTYAEDIKVVTKMSTVRGKSKVKTVLMGSTDYVNWFRIDSTTTNANSGIHITEETGFRFNYAKIRFQAFDSTGTTRIATQILINKK